MIIRNATERDASQLTALKNKEYETLFHKRLEEMKKGDIVYLVAEDNQQVVGHALVDYRGLPHIPDYPVIEDILVRVDQRNKGIGSQLLSSCEQLAKEKGFTQVGIQVNPDLNCPARIMYEKRGYKDVGNKPYLDGVYDGTEDWVIDMVKEL